MRKTFFLLLALVVVAVIAWSGGNLFARWNRQRLVSRAVSFAQKGDFKSALLTARQVLQSDPQNAPMCRLIAEMTDASGFPDSILWWSRVVKSDGGKFNDITMLVSAALRNGEIGVAGEALQQVREPDRKLLSYHLLAGGYAVAAGQLTQAEAEFGLAAAMNPKDKAIQLNLASLHLQSKDPNTVAAARAVLDQLKETPALRAAALRALLGDAEMHGDPGNALELAKELASDPSATIHDKLAYLDQIELIKGADLDGQLKAIQKTAAGNPAQIRSIVHWLNAQNRASQSLEWVRSLPPDIQSKPSVQLATSESLSVLGKWDEVREMLTKCDWHEVDFLRYAIQSRAARETGLTVESHEKWERAVTATMGDERMLAILARLVSGWAWNRETEQVWWLIARHPAGQRTALQSLYKLYFDSKNTPQLYRVIQRIYELNPNDPAAINNMAAVSLLLGKNLELAQKLALKNYGDFPKSPGSASTYAFSLYRQNKSAEGVKILRAFPDDVLRKPSIAIYYGLLLASSGDPAAAQPFLDIAAQSKDLLPEEKALLKQAR